MKLAFVADVHVGNHRRHGGPVESGVNRRCRHVLHALGEACNRAHDATFVVLGDLFDSTRPEPQVIRATRDVLDTHVGPTLIVMGNHEFCSTGVGDHALGPLEDEERGVEVIEETLVFNNPTGTIIAVPFRPGPARVWLPDELRHVNAGVGNTPRVLCLHLGVEDEETAPWLRGLDDSVHVDLLDEICRAWEIDWVFAGNWHDRRRWELPCGAEVCQVGALAPTGWDNPGTRYGYVDLLDTRSRERSTKRVSGPRFIHVDLEGLERLQATASAKTLRDASKRVDPMLYVQARVEATELDAAASIVQSLVDGGVVAAGEAVADRRAGEEATRQAADDARRATRVDEAIAAWIDAAELHPSVDRAKLRARVERYVADG